MREFVTLTLREKDWTFRALDLDQVEELEADFQAVSLIPANAASMPKEAVAAIARIAHASLQAKHPELEVAAVRKLLTIATLERVINAVRGVSGLEPAEGEAPAGMATSSTGAIYAPT